MESNFEKCEWFNENEKKIANVLPNYEVKISNTDATFFNIIKNYKSDYIENDFFKINKIATIDYDKIKEKLEKEKIKKIEECKNIQKQKETNTKCNRKIDNYKKITKTRTFQIYPNKKQKETIFKWMNECTKVYNASVNAYNNSNFNLNYMQSKLQIFESLYGDNDKPAPYDTLTDEVRSCCSNIKSCLSNLKNGNINHYELTHKCVKKGQSIFISKKSINSDGFFTRFLGSMKGFKKIDINKVTHDCRLIYDNYFDKFYLKIPMYFDIKTLNINDNIVALDPGEKIFMTYYSLYDCGTIGNDIRIDILKYEGKIRKIQSGLSRSKNRNNKKLKNKKKLLLKLRKNYKFIKDLVKEMHNKTALHLVRNYKKILIPIFETQNMVKCFGKTFIKNKVKEIKETENIYEKQKEEFKKYKKIKRLAKRVKFVLNMESHYAFRQHLINKSNEYGCEIKIVTEEYTSKCCCSCGVLSNNYDKNRIKKCPNCTTKIDRDINGSKNILIKNWDTNFNLKSTLGRKTVASTSLRCSGNRT
jgi:putative transposase